MSKSRDAQRKLLPCQEAWGQLESHYLLGPVARNLQIRPVRSKDRFALPERAYCQIVGRSTIVFNDTMRLSVPLSLGILSLATLVFALGGPRRLTVPSPVSDLAAQLAALHWWRSLKIGELPEQFELPPGIAQWGRLPIEDVATRLRVESDNEVLDGAWTLTRSSAVSLMLPGGNLTRWTPQDIDHEELFAQAMVDNAKQVLQTHHEAGLPQHRGGNPRSNPARAKRWLIAHHPLLGALLTQFDLVEDLGVCQRMNISIAAVHLGAGEIYVNPARHLGIEQAKFVIAHEILHAGLCHASRRHGRDPYLWNVACDFVINDWLVTMGIGVAPEGGLLFDEELRGWAAEDIYLRLATDLRARRRLCTLRGNDVDMLDDRTAGFFTDREEFYRRALLQGLDYHQAAGCGSLPQGLVEAIRTIDHPPIPWQAQLAEWIQQRFPLAERRRTYARPSRRQSVTPDIARPRAVAPEEDRMTRTFGVIIDTSGSMQRDELGKALGAVVSYSQAQAVNQVRLVFCDATPYDEGFVSIESLATRVSVRGRGGTVLQPAVTFLETRQDFPKRCPILIITDGLCEDSLTVSHDHAFLVSRGGRLPFPTRKPVFTMS